MAHFFRPEGNLTVDYDVDGRLAPHSVWRVRIPVGTTNPTGRFVRRPWLSLGART